MIKPYDLDEEQERRREYSKILGDLPYSEFIHRCDPDDETGYPACILQWQYAEGLLVEVTDAQNADTLRLPSPKDRQKIVRQRSEWARKLAFSLVAGEARMPVEYLQKICRKWEPPTSPVGPPFDIPS